MKFVVIVGDGMADEPLEALSNKTPLQVAKTPNMDLIAMEGRTGLAQTIPEGMAAGSDVANLSVMGYDPRKYYTGRAPLEAAAIGVELAKDDIAFRCNLINVMDGIMVDYSAGHITSPEARELIESLRPLMPDRRLYAGVSYRNLLVLKIGEKAVCTPPHDITDRPIKDYLPNGKDSELLRQLMDTSKSVMATHPVNLKRITEGKRPANMIWLWGQGPVPSLPTFQKKYGLKGAVISAVDLLKGIGVYAGLEVINVQGATGTIDTNYRGKVQALFDALDRVDFVYLHIEAPDEAAHAGDLTLKIKAIELFDECIVGPIIKGLKALGNEWRICVLPDHPTPIEIKTHTNNPVPFSVMGQGVESDEVQSFDEIAMRRGRYGQVEATSIIGIMTEN